MLSCFARVLCPTIKEVTEIQSPDHLWEAMRGLQLKCKTLKSGGSIFWHLVRELARLGGLSQDYGCCSGFNRVLSLMTYNPGSASPVVKWARLGFPYWQHDPCLPSNSGKGHRQRSACGRWPLQNSANWGQASVSPSLLPSLGFRRGQLLHVCQCECRLLAWSLHKVSPCCSPLGGKTKTGQPSLDGTSR